MKIIAPLIRYYDFIFQSPEGDTTIKSFNENEKTLFKAVLDKSVSTDIQASKLLYDGNPSGQTYMKFKQAFTDKLIKMAINMEVADSNVVISKKLKLLREWHAVRLLSNLSPTKLTRNLLKKVLLKAERMHIYNIAANVCHVLSSDYKILDKKDKEGTYYWNKYLYFNDLEFTRIKAKNAYADVIKYTRKKHINKELALKAEQAADELLQIIQEENVHANKSYFHLRYLQYILVGKHKEIIENNLKALDYFEKYNKNIDGTETLKVQIAISYFNLNQYEEALKYLEKDLNPLSKRWLLQVSLRVRAYFLKEKFQEASTFVSSIIGHPAFKEGRTVFQEKVWIFKYYADLMSAFELGKAVNTRQIKNNLTRIRVDKKGMNIPLFFADIINEVLKKGPNFLYKEQDRLMIYLNSHVKPSKNKRAELFLKFLILLPQVKFDKKDFRKKVAKIRDGFLANPMKDVVQPDNEFVNYEVLASKILAKFAPFEENVFQSLRKEELHIEEALIE